ncbi:hypothetical protein CL643_01695 [bacterium]|nr:hypothetical protein [bacterium]MBT01810.1 hypothetical protein [bacterium]|tara:strand:- start:79696 stop:79920 length:225 start_codon:yes stop_codon:yes gene_type:complete
MNFSRLSLLIAVFFLIASAFAYLLENNGLQLFKLPGDIFIKKNNISIYIPISSMIIISLLVTILYRLGIGTIIK